MYLESKFEYGDNKIKFNPRYSFAIVRNVKNLNRFESLLGNGNYAVYSGIEKIGYRKKIVIRTNWILMTKIDKLTEHYEFKTKGDSDV
jgi:hypothetical protein